MQTSTKKRLTMHNLIANIHASGGVVSLGNRISENNNGYNHYIFKAFKPLLKSSYGPVLSEILQGHQILAGGFRYG